MRLPYAIVAIGIVFALAMFVIYRPAETVPDLVPAPAPVQDPAPAPVPLEGLVSTPAPLGTNAGDQQASELTVLQLMSGDPADGADAKCNFITYMVPDRDGNLIEAIKCDPKSPPEARHPYTTYPQEALVDMAYGDSIAAEVLGLWYLDEKKIEEGMTLLYRAIALNSATEFRSLHNAANAHFSSLQHLDEDGNLVYSIPSLEQQYVMGRIGEVLGDAVLSTPSYRTLLEDAGYEDFARLESEASVILADMANIETEVTGRSTIREALNDS